jgi:hypothetical protein
MLAVFRCPDNGTTAMCQSEHNVERRSRFDLVQNAFERFCRNQLTATDLIEANRCIRRVTVEFWQGDDAADIRYFGPGAPRLISSCTNLRRACPF